MTPTARRFLVTSAIVIFLGNGFTIAQDFRALRADRTVVGATALPIASDPKRVGTYPTLSKSGGGYFFDHVLEYRVWLSPKAGAAQVSGGNDYYVAFAQFERAASFAKATKGADEPLVLVRQLEWINEPSPGKFEHKTGERVTEWRVDWLAGNQRTPEGVAKFLSNTKRK
jgi:hypothetical protein